jgi:hypothetical protein
VFITSSKRDALFNLHGLAVFFKEHKHAAAAYIYGIDHVMYVVEVDLVLFLERHLLLFAGSHIYNIQGGIIGISPQDRPALQTFYQRH